MRVAKILQMPLEIWVKRLVNDGSREAGNQIETKDRMDRTTSTVANSVEQGLYHGAYQQCGGRQKGTNVSNFLLCEIVKIETERLTLFVMRNHEFRGSFVCGGLFLLSLRLFLRLFLLTFLSGSFFLPLGERCAGTSSHPKLSYCLIS